jgi:branched-chain amino acid aminotransferase
MTVNFAHTPHPAPASDERVARVLAEPGFGKYFTDHMVSIDFVRGRGWIDPRVEPYGPIVLEPSMMVYHYGQAIFEGLKAYRQPDSSVACFRPAANAERFRRSARRMAMAELPQELFLESLRQLLAVDHRWVPAAGGEDALYLRPFMVASEEGLGVKPADRYRYMLIASPAGAYFSGTITVWVSGDFIRAAPGGTGEAKFAGNYAASLLAQAQAAEQGCDQVVWLDAAEHQWVEEMGGMNLCFVYGSQAGARILTPTLTGSLLPGITRDSLLRLAPTLGIAAEEGRISTAQWRADCASGELAEVFACGTAAVITPVGSVESASGGWTIGDGGPGPVSLRLKEELIGIQYGHRPDPFGWVYKVA